MDSAGDSDMAQALAGAIDWWREAGVDCEFADEAQSWLAAPEPEPEAAKPQDREAPPPPARKVAPRPTFEAPAQAIDPTAIPTDLAAFRSWWLAEPLLAEGPPARRVPPRGEAGAKLMVLVPEPEREDDDRLLSGPQGRLLDAMLNAMGIAADEAYLASALPRHTPGAHWPTIAAAGMGEVLLRHVVLARPQRLIILGTHALSLAGHEPPQGPAVLRKINHEGTIIPLLAARGLPALLEQPRWKAAIWRTWLDWQ